MSAPEPPRPLGEPAREARFGLPGWVDDLIDWSRPLRDDAARMRLAVNLSRENIRHGTGGPFGALVVESESGLVVSAGVNQVVQARNSTLHAEVVALVLAERRRGQYSLNAPGLPIHELVTSCEPCAMCLGAALWSGVRRIVWGAGREDASRIAFDEGPVFPESHRYMEERGIALTGGVLADEARAVLTGYQQQGGAIYNG